MDSRGTMWTRVDLRGQPKNTRRTQVAPNPDKIFVGAQKAAQRKSSAHEALSVRLRGSDIIPIDLPVLAFKRWGLHKFVSYEIEESVYSECSQRHVARTWADHRLPKNWEQPRISRRYFAKRQSYVWMRKDWSAWRSNGNVIIMIMANREIRAQFPRACFPMKNWP